MEETEVREGREGRKFLWGCFIKAYKTRGDQGRKSVYRQHVCSSCFCFWQALDCATRRGSRRPTACSWPTFRYSPQFLFVFIKYSLLIWEPASNRHVFKAASTSCVKRSAWLSGQGINNTAIKAKGDEKKELLPGGRFCPTASHQVTWTHGKWCVCRSRARLWRRWNKSGWLMSWEAKSNISVKPTSSFLCESAVGFYLRQETLLKATISRQSLTSWL